jgi:hypothetical protein
MSSPLTSLSSLDDPDERQLPGLSLPLHDPEDLKVAQVNILSVHSIANSILPLSCSCYAAFKVRENLLQFLRPHQQSMAS